MVEKRRMLRVSKRGAKRLVDESNTLNKIERSDIWHAEDPMYGKNHSGELVHMSGYHGSDYHEKKGKKHAKKSHSAPKRRASKAKDKVEKVMHEWKEGKLHSGSKKGPKVTSRKQAVAIALSEKRRAKRK